MECLKPQTTPALQFSALPGKSEHNPGLFTEGGFYNAHGIFLHMYRACTTDQPRGLVVVHHGITAHGLFALLRPEHPGDLQRCVQGSIADCLLEEGFAVYTYDAEGHGRSTCDADRGFFRSVWDFVTDFALFAKIAAADLPGLPMFAMGHSMGGGIVIGTAIKNPELFHGLILAAPMVSVEKMKHKGANKYLVPMAQCIGSRAMHCCPCLERKRWVSCGTNPDPIAAKTFDADPLTCSEPKMMAGPTLAAMTYCSELVNKLDGLSTSFLTMHSREDKLTDFDSSLVLMERAKANIKEMYETPPGSGHNILSDEHSRKVVQTRVRNWLNMMLSPDSNLEL